MSRPKLKVGAGNGHLRRLAQTAQKLAQHQAQAAELLEAIPVVSYYRRPGVDTAERETKHCYHRSKPGPRYLVKGNVYEIAVIAAPRTVVARAADCTTTLPDLE